MPCVAGVWIGLLLRECSSALFLVFLESVRAYVSMGSKDSVPYLLRSLSRGAAVLVGVKWALFR